MKRWLKYVKPYMRYFILGPLCMIVEIVGEVTMPKLLAGIVDSSFADRNTEGVIMITAFMLFTAFIMLISGIGGSYFGAKASANFAADLRSDLYRKVQGFSFSSIDRFSAGSLVTRLTNDVTQMQNFVNVLLRMALRAPGMLIGSLIMATLLEPSLSIILFIMLPVLSLFMVFIIRKGFPMFGVMQKKIDSLNSNIRESITNVRVIKSFVREDFEKEKFSGSNAALKEAGMNAMKVMICLQPVMMILMYATNMMVLWFGGGKVITGGMPLCDLTAFITYVTQLLNSLMIVSIIFVMSSRAMASAHRIIEVLDEETDISDSMACHKDMKVTQGRIEFRHVDFRYYKNSEDKVLDDITFTIEPGTTVGIIGSTGCGKSTLVSMIPRLYDPDSGEILVDGVNVKDYSLVNLREGVGMVLQKNVLFAGSIKENLIWGDENATDTMIKKAAGYAQADLFISGFSKGYDHDIGQGGTNVSGGQKQRLCIARALLKNPKILILDDSTSAVDTATESRIRTALKNGLKGSTKIIIAQRISSVIEADCIIVMNEGKITGIGRHEDLLRGNREYREIYDSQNYRREAEH